MSEDLLIAIPSNNPGGLDSELSGHFGHCDLFTLVDIRDGKIAEVTVVPSLPHEQGGCLAPVNYLAEKGVSVMIAGGMGMRPLMGFNSAGIEVFHYNGFTKLADIVSAFAEGKLSKFCTENTCGGSGGNHQGGGCH